MERTDVKNNHTEEYSTGQIRCIEKSDPEYPQIMKQYSSMPAKLYVKGRLPDPKRRTVAVIGARMCSPYGRMQAFRYAKALSVAGVQIISGMALGIDSEGHKGALEGKMPTFAVLGSGVDVCYPKSNRKLYERILWENGGIISECPLGSGPVSWHFGAKPDHQCFVRRGSGSGSKRKQRFADHCGICTGTGKDGLCDSGGSDR